MENNIIISDENLLKFFTKEQLDDMAKMFSDGSFQELINKYFYNGEQEVNKNSNNKESKLNYQILDKLSEDKLSQQIILTLILFCLLKNKDITQDIPKLFEKYNYPLESAIFPLNFLRIKYYIKSKNITKAMTMIKKLINKYEDYLVNIDEKKNDINSIYTIETFKQKFVYFYNLFNYLFNMNNLDSKIKKLYFELKSCFYQINSFSQAYQTIIALYQHYPDDIIIQFELVKDSIINSKPDMYQKILEKMKKKHDEEKDEYLKGVYHNYILYGEALYQIACNKYTDAKNKMEEIKEIKKGEKNVILNNNIAVLDIYKVNLKESYDKLVSINNEENKNDIIENSIKIIKDKFNINK